MRASTSALDAEDQDQEETPIPGAHNCPPARLFYRTFPSYVYTFFYYGCRRSERTLFYGVFRLNIRGNYPVAARASGRNAHEGAEVHQATLISRTAFKSRGTQRGGGRKSLLPFAASGLSHSADNETEKANHPTEAWCRAPAMSVEGHRGRLSIVDEADRA